MKKILLNRALVAKKKILFLTALLCASVAMFADPERIYDTNFALASNGSSATASSGNAAEAIDGNEGTRWESAHGVDPQDWELNMGQQRIFNTVKILWEGAYATHFELFYSNDGANWTSFYVEDNLTKAGWQIIETATDITAQYIKFQGTERATQYGYSFFEFQVLLPGVSVFTSIDLSTSASTADVNDAGVTLTALPKDQNGTVLDNIDISWEVTPADAGAVVDNKYIPAKIGYASIVAYSGDIRSNAVEIIGLNRNSLTLSTDIVNDNKIIAQSTFAPSGSDAFYAVDGVYGTIYQGSTKGEKSGDTEEERTYDAWFVVDLGENYVIDTVIAFFEGACSQDYHIDFSVDNTIWNLGYNYAGTAGTNRHLKIIIDELSNNEKVRYVRFWSTKAATQWGMKMYEFYVYGRTWSAPTAITNTEAEVKAVKMIENGQLVIIKNGVKYNVAGQQVK